MTKEVAEKIVRGITDKIECNTADIDDWAEFWGFTKEEYEEFLDMAKKALEQEDILDKIRAEIEIKYGNCDICEYSEDYDYEENDISEYRAIGNIADILQIIDKYKAESEE